MRLLAVFLVSVMAIAMTQSADAHEKRSHKRSWYEQRDYRSSYYRSSTVAPNGTCWRDTGRPFHSLNLNHRCDREEFWARMNDRGNDRN